MVIKLTTKKLVIKNHTEEKGIFMRIIAGKARNLELNVPAGMGVRPTSGRGRKALLDSLGDLEDAAVLDLLCAERFQFITGLQWI